MQTLTTSSEPTPVLEDGHRLLAAWEAARAPGTLRAYRSDLGDFQRFLGAATPAAAAYQLVTGSAARGNHVALLYKDALVRDGCAAATVNRRLSSLRSLVKVARLIGAITWSIEVDPIAAQPYRDTRGPGRHGFLRLVAAAETQAEPKRSRDLAILWLLYGRALRRFEVCGLCIAHVDLAGARVQVLGKHRSELEWLTVPPATVRALAQWIAVRGDSAGPLFYRLDRAADPAAGPTASRPLTGEAIRSLLATLGQRVQVRARPHGLRHAAITEALAITHGDLRAVQRYARLRSANTIRHYDDERADLGGEVAGMVAP